MSLISIAGLCFGYDGPSDIFKNLNLNLQTSWRLGLVGRNGRGKTTFLKLLAGELDHSGTIATKVRCLYFPFDLGPDHLSGDRLAELRFTGLKPWRLLEEAAALALDPDSLTRPINTLSPGEATKLKLAVLFAQDDVFPLLDEPTGGLDETGRALLASFLGRKKGFIVVSHDRFLLESAADHILSLGRHGPELHKGSFQSFWHEYQLKTRSEAELSKKLSREVKRLAISARNASEWSRKTERGKYGQGPVDRGFIGHKSAKMAQRAKAVADRRQSALEEKKAIAWTAERAPAMSLNPLPFPGHRLLEGRAMAMGYTDRVILHGLDLTLDQGERLAVKGPNGSGKSLLLALLSNTGGTLMAGSLRLSSGLILSYVPQTSPRPAFTISNLCRDRGADETAVKSLLNHLGLGPDDLRSNLQSLSQGQWRKTLLALSLSTRAHLYIWDEPLAFLDLFSRAQIEDLIMDCGPSLIVVEHDLAFVERVATRLLDLTPYSHQTTE
jgi:lincosamide and streptogramin A transport system ATP-binding/permease protein